MKNLFGKLIFGVAAVAALSGGQAFAQQPIELRFAWWGGDSRHVATQNAVKAFEQKNPNIKVKPEFGAFQGYQEKLATQLAGKTEPDLMQVNWNWLTIFSKDGSGFGDLTKYTDAVDLGQFDKSLLETGMRNGKLNGLPVSMTGRVFFFNATEYEKAGVPIPKTWNELKAAAPAFKAKLGPDFFPFDAAAYNAWLTVSLYASQRTGKSYIDPDKDVVAWTKPQLVEALNFYKSLVDGGVIKSAAASASEGKAELFERRSWADGKLGGSYEWDSTYSKYADPLGASQKLQPVSILKADGAQNDGVFRKPSMMFSISARTTHPKEAAMLLNYIMNDPDGVRAMTTERGIPASKKAAEQLVKEGKVPAVLAQAQDYVMKASAPALSVWFEHTQISEIYNSTMEEFGYGKINADQAADRLIGDVNTILAKLTR